MENQVTLHAERVLSNVDKNLTKEIKKLVVRNALNIKAVDAIDALLTLVENSRSFSPRLRKLRRTLLLSLVKLGRLTYLSWQLSAEEPEFHRTSVATMSGSDHTILKYWGFIIPGKKKGYWRITKDGMRFLMGWISVPGYVLCGGGPRRENYTFNGCDSDVEISQFVDPAEVKGEFRGNFRMIDSFIKSLPQGEPLPSMRKNNVKVGRR